MKFHLVFRFHLGFLLNMLLGSDELNEGADDGVGSDDESLLAAQVGAEDGAIHRHAKTHLSGRDLNFTALFQSI